MIAWSTPRTWVAGETPTAAQFNAHLRENPVALDQHAHTGNAGDGAPISDMLALQVFAAR